MRPLLVRHRLHPFRLPGLILWGLLATQAEAQNPDLDLTYHPEPGLPQTGQPKVLPRLPQDNLSTRSIFILQKPNQADSTEGWDVLRPQVSASRPVNILDERQAVRAAELQMDEAIAKENPISFAEQLPESLRALPLSIDMGVRYHF